MDVGVDEHCSTGSLTFKVLVVEDDLELAVEIVETLTSQGATATAAHSYDAAVTALKSSSQDAVLLDQWLGHIDSVTRIPCLRKLTPSPIIVLTANTREADRIVALEMGADDFLVKPVSARELVARIRAKLRRSPKQPRAEQQTAWRVAALERRVYRPDGVSCGLTATEFDVFHLLYENQDRPVTRSEISIRVLRREFHENDRSVDSLVFSIRKKLGHTDGAECIETVRRQGYRFRGFADA